MTQNIYDNPAFFEGYSQLGRSVEGLAGAAEWPSLRAMLPELKGLRVVDLGCGYGWFCRYAREQGAAEVLGLDVSEQMLARARSMTSDAGIRYERTDLEHLDLPPAAFDFAYSSLTLHYIADLADLLSTLHRALLPGSRFVLSIEHPIYMAPTRPDWATDAEGRRIWPLDRYSEEGERTTDWLAKGVVKQHRTMGTLLTLLIRAGFTLDHVEEWSPTDAEIAAHPDWAPERDRPMFLLIGAHR
ncbi:class I SAM-dependent methyltransferase [Kaistia granuli]|uniref:class I SAM-dependent methyltransferase n=1 Tax=Kaistia granuli TaxID=363259 RepID=UPI0003743FE9|nr:class I SAM-dependent methyltransferase [Kaistia granuli]